jgi:hypothetical protein
MIFNHYTGRAALLFSMFLEWAANFNRYRTITNRFKFMDKLKFRYKILIMFLYCMIFYSYIFLKEDCVLDNRSQNITSTRYRVGKVGLLNYSSFGIVIKFIHSFIRDILLEIMIAIISIMTLIYIRHWIIKRKNLNNSNEGIEKSEINLTLMILTTSLVNFIGHIFSFLFSLPSIDINSDCLNATSNLLLYTSYSINFFIYLIFNKHFKSYLKNKWLKLNECLLLVFKLSKSRKFGEKYKTNKMVNDQTIN